jgi:anti-sigma factor RsiW
MTMTCRELYGFLDEYLNGVLGNPTRQTFERHLERCAACRRYLSSYRATLRLAHDAEIKDGPAGTEAPEELVLAILHSRTAAFSRLPPE